MSQSMMERLVVSVAGRLLPRNVRGRLDVTLPSGKTLTLGGAEPGEQADLTLRNFKVLWAAFRRAQLGFFERYLAGDVESKNPTAFFRFYLQNRPGLDEASSLFTPSLFDKIWHRLRDN